MTYGIVNPPRDCKGWAIGFGYYGLAHEILKVDLYKNYYRELSRLKKFLILDSGADELGSAIPNEEFMELARYINPTVLVLPDVLGDAKATLSRSQEFLDRWEGKEPESQVQFMAVLQGGSYEEVMEMSQEEIEWKPRLLGVPYDIDFEVPTPEGFKGIQNPENTTQLRASNRQKLVTWLSELYPHQEFHLLGMNQLSEFPYYSQIPNVFSNDTTAPFAAAAEGIALLGDTVKSWKPLDFDKSRKDFDRALVGKNLEAYFTALNDPVGLIDLIGFWEEANS